MLTDHDQVFGERIARVEQDSAWIKNTLTNMDGRFEKMERNFDSRLKTLDKRVWWILGSIVAVGVVSIAVNVGLSLLP